MKLLEETGRHGQRLAPRIVPCDLILLHYSYSSRLAPNRRKRSQLAVSSG